MVELMMVSGVQTSSGFEERIRFSELEIVDANAIESGVLSSMPEGNYLNGWDVNLAGVRITSVRRNIRHHKHAVSFCRQFRGGSCLGANCGQEFLLRVKRKGGSEIYVGRRYGDFARLHKNLRTELPGRVLPPMPKKNKSDATAPGDSGGGNYDSETSSISSASTRPPVSPAVESFKQQGDGISRLLSVKDQRSNGRLSPRTSVDGRPKTPVPSSPKPQEVRIFHMGRGVVH